MLSDGTWTYTWEHGRELATMSDGSTTWTYTYNADGLSIQRTNGNETYEYVYKGSNLTWMSLCSTVSNYAYDVTDSPMAIASDNLFQRVV